jgi:hypothetical protein
MSIAGVDHELWVIGDARDEARVSSATPQGFGLPVSARIAAPLRRPQLAVRRFANVVEERYWSTDHDHQTPDIQVSWSVNTASLLRSASGSRAALRLAMVVREPVPAIPGSLEYRRQKHALSHTQPVVFDDTVREAIARAASARRGGTFQADNIRIIDPPMLPQREPVSEAERAALKAALGLPPDFACVVYLNDPPSAGDVHRFAFLLGLVFAAHVRVSGVVPVGLGASGVDRMGFGLGGAGLRSARAARFVRDHSRRWGLTLSEWPLHKLLRAADAAVYLPADHRLEPCAHNRASCGPTSIALALSLGVPVFTSECPMARRIFGEHSGLAPMCIGHGQTVNHAGAAMIPVLMDPARLADARRASSRRGQEIALADGFRRDLKALWEEMTSRPIARPGLPLPPALRDPEEAQVLVNT